jgi:hypothetical protein
VTGTWIILGWVLLVLDVNSGLEDLACLRRFLEVTNGSSLLVSMMVRVVQGRTNGVLSSTGVHIYVHFLGGDGRWLWHHFVDLVLVRVGEVLLTCSVQVCGQTSELETVEVGAWTWVCQV